MGVKEQLLSAIENSGLTLYVIAKDIGVDYGTVHRFVHYDRNIGISTVDRLADYFGMSLTKPIRPKQEGGA